ncbi:MAG: PIG-L family deacetylase, partial [Pseudomonadota bacterium]|nr:PIG-L family deacetylase [Pseudomonadota bacterium]
MNKVLVISPHPDDETLGCGGTLIRHKKEGDEIHWLIMTNVNSSEKKFHSVKEKEIGEVSKA